MSVKIDWGSVQRPANRKPFVKFVVRTQNDNGEMAGEICVDVEGDVNVRNWAESRLKLLLEETLGELRQTQS